MIAVRVQSGRWVDSARMLAAARAAEGTEGVDRAACFMGTPANVSEARALGLDDPALDAAGPDDLVVAARGPSAGDGVAAAEAALSDSGARGDAGATARAPRTLRDADGEIAVVSVPGEYAALEAHKALGAGMDVVLFSDGVSLDDEVALKERAHALGRLIMGPGAGTALLGGVGLGFANAVAAGPVGVAAAAGTGAQEVMVLLDRAGSGVSACYGTGGRDLSERVGARTMLDAIGRLSADPDTGVILVVSKPPAPAVVGTVMDALAATGKPAVACFVGGPVEDRDGVVVTATLDEAAAAAAAAAGVRSGPAGDPEAPAPRPGALRGLFSGGTLCGEASALLVGPLGDVASNAPGGAARKLAPGERPPGHVCLDLGEEEYTRGRPHPMIDPEARAELIAEEGGAAGTAVLLIDVVLGLASHPDPAGALIPAIERARAGNPRLAVVAHVLGTDADAQGLTRQERALREAGVVTCPSNASAARVAAAAVA